MKKAIVAYFKKLHRAPVGVTEEEHEKNFISVDHTGYILSLHFYWNEYLYSQMKNKSLYFVRRYRTLL
jgi:hypothetical protein